MYTYAADAELAAVLDETRREIDYARTDLGRDIEDVAFRLHERIDQHMEDRRQSTEELWAEIGRLRDDNKHLNAAVVLLTERLDRFTNQVQRRFEEEDSHG